MKNYAHSRRGSRAAGACRHVRPATAAALLLAAAGCAPVGLVAPCTGEDLHLSPATVKVDVEGVVRVQGIPCGPPAGVTWRVQDTTIARVSGSGEDPRGAFATVLGRRAGATTLVATFGGDTARKATGQVTVEPADFPITRLSIQRGAIELGGHVLLRGDTLRGTLLLFNPGKDTTLVTAPSCSIGIRAYGDSARNEPTPWRMRLTATADCGSVLSIRLVPGGATDSLVTVAREGDWLPTLPAGHYWFALVIRPDSSLRWIRAGEGDVP